MDHRKSITQKRQDFTVVQLIVTLIYLALGGTLIAKPGVIGQTFCIIVGTCTLIFGLFKLLPFIQEKRHSFLSAEFIVGVVFTAIGVFALISPPFVLSILPIVMGIVVLLDGVSHLFKALYLKKLGFAYWWALLLAALAACVLGGLLIYNPFSGPAPMARLLGVGLCLDGVTALALFVCIFAQLRRNEAPKAPAPAAAPQEPGALPPEENDLGGDQAL